MALEIPRALRSKGYGSEVQDLIFELGPYIILEEATRCH
jgi:hypothetical protein